ncbi:unnamed protein product, partial [Rotaria sp. Silwood2]
MQSVARNAIALFFTPTIYNVTK